MQAKRFSFCRSCTHGVTAEQASNVGQLSFEHLFGSRKSFSEEAEQQSLKWENEVKDTSNFNQQIDVLLRLESSGLRVDSAVAKRVAKTLVINNTAVVPTIVALFGISLDVDSLEKITPLTQVPES